MAIPRMEWTYLRAKGRSGRGFERGSDRSCLYRQASWSAVLRLLHNKNLKKAQARVDSSSRTSSRSDGHIDHGRRRGQTDSGFRRAYELIRTM